MSHHLHLFGFPELHDAAGRVIHFRTRKQMALLAYLALDARVRPVSRGRIVELLWSDVPPAKGRHSLSQSLTAIRAAFGKPVVRRVGESVQFVAPLTTDLDTPQLTGGDVSHPLRELEDCAGADFAHWVEATRQRCTQTARTRLVDAIEKARLSGDGQAVHERAETLYSIDPVSDLAAHIIAERFLLRGDTGSALRFLREHLERADRELGRVDHAGLKRLLRHIEVGTPPRDPVATASPPKLQLSLAARRILWGGSRS